jgi:hypothetical protein
MCILAVPIVFVMGSGTLWAEDEPINISRISAAAVCRDQAGNLQDYKPPQSGFTAWLVSPSLVRISFNGRDCFLARSAVTIGPSEERACQTAVVSQDSKDSLAGTRDGSENDEKKDCAKDSKP